MGIIYLPPTHPDPPLPYTFLISPSSSTQPPETGHSAPRALGNIRLVRSAIPLRRSKQFLIRPHQPELQANRARRRSKTKGHHADEGTDVARLLAGHEHVRRGEVTKLGDQVAESDGDGALLGGLAQHTADVAHDQGVGNVHAADVDEGRSVPRLRVAGGETDDEA
jgi:hypothetical protein